MKIDNLYTDWINSLKGIAIIGVVLIHYANYVGVFSGGGNKAFLIGRVAQNGNLGVEIFYLINGFLCFMSLNKKGMNISIKEYGYWVFRKLVRLVPLYYLAMIVNHILCFGREKFSLWNILSHYLFFNFCSPFWYNSYFPGSAFVGDIVLIWIILCLYYKKLRNSKDAVCYVAVVYCICNACLMLTGETWYVEWVAYFCRAMQAFSVGIFLFYSLLVVQQKESINNSKLCSYGVVLLVVSYFIFHIDAVDRFVFCVLVFLLVLAMYQHECGIVINPVFEYLGKYSWGIFLFHIIIYQIVEKYHMYRGEIMHCIVSLAITIGVSKLLTDFYETPLLKYVHKMV